MRTSKSVIVAFLSDCIEMTPVRRSKFLQVADKNNFAIRDEKLIHLGLITIQGGLVFTPEGFRYPLQSFDLRSRISRRRA
jgi:thiamine pyrophosphokinase